MIGGADSFNLLVPKCNDAYEEYMEARKKHALPKTSLTTVTATDQGTCSEWGINNLMSTVADHYQAGQVRLENIICGEISCVESQFCPLINSM